MSDNEFQISIDKKSDLYDLYMPYIKNGALFIQTNKSYCLGDPIIIHLSLMGEKETYTLKGSVQWITPIGAQGGLTAGIGVQFSEDSQQVRNKIETYLVGSNHSDRRTRTM